MLEGPVPRLQDLSPRWARFCLAIRGFAAGELACDFPAHSCLVACSGGPDSTSLLLIAALLCRSAGGRVSAAHVDHRLRPESGADAAFVAGLCRRLEIPFVTEAHDVAALARGKGIGVEEAGRTVRYDFLEKVRRECGAECILLGHQLNDLAEDQMLRLLRGAGWPGLGGMPAYDSARHVLRPLLLTPKATLEAFLRALGQTWRIDATNAACETLRNRVRHGILPAMLAENPAYLKAAARLWRQAHVDAAYWDAAVNAALARVRSEDRAVLIPDDLLQQAAEPLRLRVFKAVLGGFGPGQALCDGLFRLDELWRGKRRGRAIRFPGDKEACITRQGVRIQGIDRKKASG